jgi:hypothetical protein
VTVVVSAWTRLSFAGRLVMTIRCTGLSGMILVQGRTDGHTALCSVLHKEHVNTERILVFLVTEDYFSLVETDRHFGSTYSTSVEGRRVLFCDTFNF